MGVELQTSGNIPVTAKLKKWLNQNGYKPKTLSQSAYALKCAEAMVNGDLDGDTYLKLTDSSTKEKEMPNAKDVYDTKNVDSGRIRLRKPSEGLSEKRYEGTHVKTGKPVMTAYGEPACIPSEKDFAVVGTFLKHSAKKSGMDVELTEWERTLWQEMIAEHEWASYGGEPTANKTFSGDRVKALLDDSISGGLEIAPVAFDDSVVGAVLLTGELFPFIDRKPISRGRRVEGASVGHPTLVWGVGEGTEGGLQDFADYVAAINTTVYPCTCYCEIGRDFLSDSPVNVGQILIDRIAEAWAKECDDIVANGNGTTQPEGVMSASGTTGVTWGSATSLANYESLLFAVAKQYRKAQGNRFMFCGNETSYMRMRAIPVGTADARRIFGMSHESYECFPPRRFAINEDLSNSELFAGDMGRYRWYERLGLSTQWSTEGKSLLRSNTALLACRMRAGAQVMIGEAFATVSDAPA